MVKKEILADKLRAMAENPQWLDPYAPDFGSHGNPRIRLGQTIKNLMNTSRKYVMTPDASFAAARLGYSHPELLTAILRRARPPFDRIWLEWSVPDQLRAADQEPDNDCPPMTGAFIEAITPGSSVFRVTSVGHDRMGDSVALAPLSVLYNINEPEVPIPLEDTLQICEATDTSRLTLRMTLLGSAFVGRLEDGTLIGKYEGLTDEQIRVRSEQSDFVARHAGYTFNPYTPYILAVLRSVESGPRHQEYKYAIRMVLREQIREHTGSWRFIISALALLNARDYITDLNVPLDHKSRLVKGKIVPYMQHHTIGIKLPREITVKRVMKSVSQGLPKRAHEVSGHYANSHRSGDPTCVHLPIVGCDKAVYVKGTETLEVCQICGHRRWWVRDYTRGDASLGFVTKDFNVDKRQR